MLVRQDDAAAVPTYARYGSLPSRSASHLRQASEAEFLACHEESRSPSLRAVAAWSGVNRRGGGECCRKVKATTGMRVPCPVTRCTVPCSSAVTRCSVPSVKLRIQCGR